MLSIIVYAIPFVVGIVLAASLFNAFANFRRARRAPYFRIRRDATRAGWRWMLIGMAAGLAIAAAVTARRYVPAPDLESMPLSNAEPTLPTLELAPSPMGTPESDAATKDPIAAPPTITPTQPTPSATSTPYIATIESRVTPPANAVIDITAVSSSISSDLRPVNASDEFPVGTPRLYVWLEYDNMADGVSFSRAVLYNGDVLQVRTEPWERGEEGIAYYYFDAQNGWPPGSYEVQFYIGDKLADTQSFSVIN